MSKDSRSTVVHYLSLGAAGELLGAGTVAEKLYVIGGGPKPGASASSAVEIFAP